MNASLPTSAGRCAGLVGDDLIGKERARTQPARGPRAVNECRSSSRLLDDVWPATSPRLLRLAIGLGIRGDRAADVVQEVYVAALERPPAIVDADELVRWLFRVAVNRCHLEHRRRGRWQRLWQSLAAAWQPGERSGAAGELGELRTDVARALARLSEADRDLVVMRYFAELNSREIGEIAGIPEATVRGRLRAARRKLAEELKEWDDGGQ